MSEQNESGKVLGIRLILVGLVVMTASMLMVEAIGFRRWLSSDYARTAWINVWLYLIIHPLCLLGIFVGALVGCWLHERARRILVGSAALNLMAYLLFNFAFSVKYRGLTGATPEILSSHNFLGVVVPSLLVLVFLTPRSTARFFKSTRSLENRIENRENRRRPK